ncbi:class A beta-lactamase-related serine hydrolase [Halobacillus trueperi]|uniref:Class A beta-lactamase-related serine hydrolase n=1 Tax=Halobacillus trueperi TaxID=156205 RepID=A0A3D8VNT4_9BACI|nr:class A beta-lactamase-related serine hydrolase [Halobacillus trueperi]
MLELSEKGGRKLKKKTVSILLTTALGATLLSPNATLAAPGPTIEKGVKTNVHTNQSTVHPAFSWDQPGPSSPILHPGSVRGAGMREEPLQEIDPLLLSAIENNVMPGAVTLVARRGHIVKEEAYGYAMKYEDDEFTQSENPIPMTKDTIFDLASISKIFTTTAAMILYEQNAFELNDPVAKHLPEFAENGKENVTIEQLLTHTSGFKAWIPLYTVEGDRNDRLQHVLQYPLANEPGSTYTYSDLNMITLGALVERLSNMRLDEFVEKNITKPLKMEDTMYNPEEDLKSRIAATEDQPWTNRGLVWGEVHDESAWSLDGVAGHAGVFSTANDLAKFAHMFLNEGTYGNKKILEPETVKLLTENRIPQFAGDDHGLGWELQQGWYMDALSSPRTYGHTGYTGTSIVVNPENDTIAILLTNRVHPTRDTVSTNGARRGIARKVADAIPVQMDKKSNPWFSGYGDQVEKQLLAKVNLSETASLSFRTWFEIEDGYDFGTLEVSDDGETWTTLDRFTGDSNGWVSRNVELPSGTTHLRFIYETDGSVNNRGWYIDNLEINGNAVEVKSDSWEKRSY